MATKNAVIIQSGLMSSRGMSNLSSPPVERETHQTLQPMLINTIRIQTKPATHNLSSVGNNTSIRQSIETKNTGNDINTKTTEVEKQGTLPTEPEIVKLNFEPPKDYRRRPHALVSQLSSATLDSEVAAQEKKSEPIKAKQKIVK
jgi:hypothetical protein